MCGVDLGELLPLVGKIVQREDGRHGADGNTGAAVNAFDGIYIELRCGFKFRCIFFGVDAIHRARIYARCILVYRYKVRRLRMPCFSLFDGCEMERAATTGNLTRRWYFLSEAG